MTRRLLRSALAIAALAASLLAGAMRTYPGGTHWDRAAPGHDFWRNYLCDLARTVAINGCPNPLGSALARAAIAAIALDIAIFFWLVPRIFLQRCGAVRALGCVAAAGAFAVAIFPADRCGAAHDVAILVGGVAGLVATCMAMVRLERVTALFGAVTLALAAAAFVLYLRQFVAPGPGPVAASVFERLALLALAAWMGAAFWRVSRGEAGTDRR